MNQYYVLFLAALLEYAAILLLLKKRRKPLIRLEIARKSSLDPGDDEAQTKRELTRKPVSQRLIWSLEILSIGKHQSSLSKA